MNPISIKQAEALSFMITFYAENDQLPPIAVVAQHLGIWGNHANDLAVALEKKGYIQRNAVGKFKFTELGRILALEQLEHGANARWPILGAKPSVGGDRPVGKGTSTRDTTKPCQQEARATSPTAGPCRLAPVNGPRSIDHLLHGTAKVSETGVTL